MRHFRSVSILVGSSLVLCCVVYPLALLGVGKAVFPDRAEGSLISATDEGGNPRVVGSRLIAQNFTRDEYFQPRPSAASYDAKASSGSNLGPNNPVLRERVAWSLGPIVKFSPRGPQAGQPVGPSIEQWVYQNPAVVARWVAASPDAPRRWLEADEANKKAVAKWKGDRGQEGEPTPEDVVAYFRTQVEQPTAKWAPELGGQVQSVFFDAWRSAHPDAELEQVPGDLVMTSGSGLDPHITLAGARFQLDRVVSAWAKKLGRDEPKVRQDVEELLRAHACTPLGGWNGPAIVNVLEVNVALAEKMAP